ncbi:MAG: hypothetical protein GXP30_04695 [Verrucomicrobia bacterium]|nr:hypothetical protein [Verrucomicrobiota bacterium]
MTTNLEAVIKAIVHVQPAVRKVDVTLVIASAPSVVSARGVTEGIVCALSVKHVVTAIAAIAAVLFAMQREMLDDIFG